MLSTRMSFPSPSSRLLKHQRRGPQWATYWEPVGMDTRRFISQSTSNDKTVTATSRSDELLLLGHDGTASL
ncbi:hypothetical protein EYF80_002693 [Liparis tanakae]|uniref:Uncharacterized protein n=1 Tax=Liparis tanakae TaxID=230148 RepID=A0A4Z2JBB7_9TELE|nr:hypothetical protein EYF80_002693 [Liparis tanakae]